MKTELPRRDFLLLSALAGAGLTFDFLSPATAAAPASFSEAEALTPLAIADDGIALAALATGLAAPLRHSLTTRPAIVYVSGLLRHGEQQVIPLLMQCRTHWDKRKDGDFTVEKLALAAGWLLHQATRATFQPLWQKLGDEATISACRLYHDVTLLREWRGEQGQSATVSRQDLSDLFRAMSQRLMIRLHTFEPDEEDVDGWLERLLAWRTRQQQFGERFAAVYLTPDPAQTRRFVTAVNFYRRGDAVIRAARALHRGTLITSDAIQSAAQASATQSLYAQALARGWNYQQAVSDFLLQRIDEAELKTRLSLNGGQR